MKRYRLFHTAALVALPSLLLATSLRAQPLDPNAAAAEYRKAYAAIAKEDWPKAREILLEVWKTNKTYDVASSLGQVEFKLGHYASAARFMDLAIANVAPSEKPEFIQRLKSGMREVRLRVTSIRVTVNEPGAEVAIGAEVMGTSPLTREVFLDPGSHVITAEKDGRTAKANVVAKAGESFDLPLTLPAKAATAPTSGLDVDAPAVPSSEPPRAEPSRERVSVVPVIVGGAVAAVSLATGIVLRVSAGGSYDDAEALRKQNGPDGCATGAAPKEDCEAQVDANGSGDTKTNASTVAFAVAGGALLATAAYWFWPRDSSTHASRPAARLHGGVDATGGFLGISYDF